MPALKPQPFGANEALREISALPDWAQPAFEGMKSLNRCGASVFVMYVKPSSLFTIFSVVCSESCLQCGHAARVSPLLCWISCNDTVTPPEPEPRVRHIFVPVAQHSRPLLPPPVIQSRVCDAALP